MTDDTRRVSFGGQMVRESLLAVGATLPNPMVSLIETASPARRYEAVLVQSAWNVIPRNAFDDFMRPYPARMRRRALARRAVTRVNLHRARRVVCLTNTVAEMLSNSLGVRAEVAPVTVPVHDWREPRLNPPSEISSSSSSFALVTGTVTWYKRPHAVLDLLTSNERLSNVRKLVFCGKDDGSGCWQQLQRDARRQGVEVSRMTVPHDQLYDFYRQAVAVILPSALESLGFGLAEALAHSKNVIASTIPAHREVARRLGREPQWMGDEAEKFVAPTTLLSYAEAADEWRGAAHTLGLM